MLELKLACQFDDFVLQIGQHLPTDKIVGLFGSSGCGKSRFIRQILGFDQDYQIGQRNNEIIFKDRVWLWHSGERFIPSRQRGIGYLPQSVDLFPHLNVADNIYFGFNKRPIKPQQALIDMVLKQLDIEHLMARFPHQLSGGQKQRAGLARAIFAASNLLVLDEPMSAIGEDHKAQAMRLLQTLNRQYQLPILYSSHSRLEHAFITDYLVTLDNGKVIQSGDYESISTDIDGRFAQMPDAINHIKAKSILFEQDVFINRLQTTEHHLWAGHQPLEKNTLVNLEIRAQDISLGLEFVKNSSILNCLKVSLLEFKEVSNHQFLVKLQFEATHLIAFITKKSFVKLELKVGQQLFAMFKAVSVLPISIERE